MVDALEYRLEVFRRHRWKAITAFLIIVLSATSVLLVLPDRYQSDAALFVQTGRESVTLDPIATIGPTMSVQSSREYEINTVSEVLRNDALADVVAESIGFERLLRSDAELQKVYGGSGIIGNIKLGVARWLKSKNRDSDTTDQELSRKVVSSGLSVKSVPESSIITISCRAETPELARDIAATLVDSYLSQHMEMHQTQGSEQFFATQTKLVEQRLKEAQAELRELKNKTGILTIVGNQAHLQQQLDQLEQQRLTVEAELASAQSHAALLLDFVDRTPDRVTTSETSGPNSARDSMRQQLFLQEIELEDLQSRLTESHPQVVSAKKKIADARTILESQPDERSQVVSNLNATDQSLALDAMRQQALEAGYKSKLSSLNEQREAVLERIKAANAEQAKIESLERRVELLAASYKIYAEKLEASRITTQLQADQISNVHVLQNPTVSSQPVASNKSMLFVVALMLGILAAYLIVVLSEVLDRRVHCPEDVEELAGLPVLVSVPRVARRYASLN